MITDVPISDDFRQSGIGFLGLAWENAITPYLEFDQAAYWDIDPGEVTEEYWNAAQKSLANALALVQQAVELLLKGKIAAVSPFLLIPGSPREWPTGCDVADTPFSEFRTIDAQDLIRAHDTVCRPRLPEDFKERFNRLRGLRNTIFHTVDKTLRFTSEEVLHGILDATDVLIGPQEWFALRKKDLEGDKHSALYSSDFVHGVLVQEILCVVDLFPPSLVKKFLGFNKRQRRYICYDCDFGTTEYRLNEMDRVTLAQLQPNSPTSTNVYCIACEENIPVLREDCLNPDCRGNVVHAGVRVCLTCGYEQSDFEK